MSPVLNKQVQPYQLLEFSDLLLAAFLAFAIGLNPGGLWDELLGEAGRSSFE